MAATIQLKFGSLAFDSTNNVTISEISEKAGKPVRVSGIPKTDGGIAETAKLNEKVITIAGDIAGTSYDNLRANIDAMRSGLLNGIQKLTKDNERYIMAQCKSFDFKYDHLTRRATWTATFVAHFPFWLSETLHTDSRTPVSGTRYTLANAGNAPTRVKVAITAPGAGISDDVQVENIVRGELCKYRGDVNPGSGLIMDNRVVTDDFIVTNAGTSDFPNFEGDFIHMGSGDNSIEFTGTAGVTICSWRDAWY